MLNRREFLGQSSLALAALAFWPTFTADGRHISVQLWSVKEDMKRDPVTTLKIISSFGFKEVEGAGYENGLFYGMEVSAFATLLDELGLKMPSAHCMLGPQDLLEAPNDVSKRYQIAIEKHAELGCSYIINPWIAPEDRHPEYFIALCDGMNRAGKLAIQNGLRLGYHNHEFEFLPSSDGSLMYDLLLERCSSDVLDLQLDLYWVAFANQDPITWFKKAPGRFKLFHVKDMAKTPERETIEIGTGSINFQEIFKYQVEAGTEHFVIELEHYKSTPLAGVSQSFKALKKLKFT